MVTARAQRLYPSPQCICITLVYRSPPPSASALRLDLDSYSLHLRNVLPESFSFPSASKVYAPEDAPTSAPDAAAAINPAAAVSEIQHRHHAEAASAETSIEDVADKAARGIGGSSGSSNSSNDGPYIKLVKANSVRSRAC